ncbi:MAG: ABC transporter ATP-binding protein, partial [Rhodoplanes sp.]
MSEIVVRAENLTKAYTLYPSSWDRMREILGFRRRLGVDFPQHMAIDDITLTIRAGEKVAFIGRNGAGKSTLLKLVTGLIEPTSGRLDIRGETHALLQIGGGFHPELTGRQNAYAYLANLGLSRAAADRAVDDIIGFSELEEYIDQPLKTYSTGMQMRLIFAASTTIAPKLFVVDEVLGVGDGYFQHKSFGRIQELCERNGTTLLLVSHDIYSAAKLCERMIWIDRGRIKFDGDPKTALNLYESSIKEQEEQRLRKKAVLVGAAKLRDASERRVIVVELLPANGRFAGQVDLLDARLMSGANELARLRMDEPEAAPAVSPLTAQLEIVEEGSSWQHISSDGIAASRVALADHGSVFQKGLMRAVVPAGAANLRLELQLASPSSQTLIGLIYDDALRPRRAGDIELAAGLKAESLSLPLDCSALPEYQQVQNRAKECLGTGDIRITEVLFFSDETPLATTRLTQLQPFALEIRLQKINP